MWRCDQKGNREFAHGKEAWVLAAEQAGACALFVADVEEEQVVEEELSCYNCRYRRWSVESFTCLRLPPLSLDEGGRTNGWSEGEDMHHAPFYSSP
ncbi:hypothetical protein [Geomonas diazotrophica]|uniref:hypothetical protein n=1 Tax=Geomonas diazotrophica TaxID=2843197 RepID=UPI001EEF8FBA|nr:hypothetical protein [Geomonas nitrogeniifigens]